VSARAAWTPIGTLVSLERYPLKGTTGETLDAVKIGWHGLSGDRQHALLRTDDTSGLPWVSPREFPKVVAWRSAQLQQGVLHVETRDGTEWTLAADDIKERERFERFATDELGAHLSLVTLWRGTFDSMSVSVITTATISDTAALVGDPDFDARRLRPNIAVELFEPRPGAEQKWIGRELRLGEEPDSAVLRIDRTTTRCEVVDLNPCTGVADRDLFAKVREQRRNRVGVYAGVGHPGFARIGATIAIR